MGITDAGWDGLIATIGNPTQPDNFDYVAVGTGTTGFAAGDTTLETEIVDSGLARALGDYAHTGSTKIWTITEVFTVTGTKAVTESGVLNAASTGTLLCRDTFTAKNVVNGDTLTVVWTFTGS